MTNFTQDSTTHTTESVISTTVSSSKARNNGGESISRSSCTEDITRLLSCSSKRARYRKTYIAWDKIRRANAPDDATEKTKHLSRTAQDIAGLVIQKLQKSDKVYLNHKYLSMITKCQKRQNLRIIEQLADVLDITYHISVLYEERRYRYSYEFCHKKEVSNKMDSGTSEGEDVAANTEREENAVATFSTSHSIYIKTNYLKDRSMSRSKFSKNSESDSAINSNSLQEDNPQDEVEARAVTLDKPKRATQNAPGQNALSQNQSKRQSKSSAKAKTPANNPWRGGYQTPKTLADFHPLSQEDCEEFRRRSGREFDSNAMNEILLSISRKKPEVSFNHKNGFLTYMTKAYLNEMRDAVKISNGTYRIKSNITEAEKEEGEKERYLTEIENTGQVSPEWHLKKKLVSVLERSKAYALLRAYKRIVIEGNTAKLFLHEAVVLTSWDMGIVLAQVKASHERYEDGEHYYIDKVEFVLPEVTRAAKHGGSSLGGNKAFELPNNLWGRIRRQLIDIYGQALDGHWFAKLEADVDEERKIVDLKASSSLSKSWIKSNYIHTMDRIAAAMGATILV